MVNWVSYNSIEFLLWQNLKNGINSFRESKLRLKPILAGGDGWHLIHSHKVPFAKMWCPELVPKPKDWAENVDVVGTFFDSPIYDNTMPPPPISEALKNFLNHEIKPIFVGFGSMVIRDPKNVIFNFLLAASYAKVRIIFQGGWSTITDAEFDEIIARVKAARSEDTYPEEDFNPYGSAPSASTAAQNGGGWGLMNYVSSTLSTVTSVFGAKPTKHSSVSIYFRVISFKY